VAFGGQQFIPGTLSKMKKLAEIRAVRGYNYRIEVDGGVALNTVGGVVLAGAEVLVAGNAVFGSGDPKANASALLEAAREVKEQGTFSYLERSLATPELNRYMQE